MSPGTDAMRFTASTTPGMKLVRSVVSWRMTSVWPVVPRMTSWLATMPRMRTACTWMPLGPSPPRAPG